MGNKPILLPSMGNLWHKKTNTASEVTQRFSTVEGLFCYLKNLVMLVTYRFSMYGKPMVKRK